MKANEMQFYIQYREDKTKGWKFVKSDVTGQRIKFWERRDAQRCMERVFNAGYDAQIVVFETKMKWLERKERCLEKVDELYVVSVSGRNVFVLGNGKMGKARCNPEDKFDLAKGISLALERMNDEISEGDWVEVVDPGYAYTTYSGWVSENIKDKTMIAEYRYGESVPKYLEGKVIKIDKHHMFDDTLAFIKGHNGYYLICLKGLKKVKR